MNITYEGGYMEASSQVPEAVLKLVEGQIEATDTQIDTLVYELYGLTDEEIRIVEGEGE